MKGNVNVWDAWPVNPAFFGEATVTARRAASDPLGASDVSRAWSSRVDEAVQGLDGVDPTGVDAWMSTHAQSPVPEVYEARLVAAWESRQAEGAASDTSEQEVDTATHDAASDAVEVGADVEADGVSVVADEHGRGGSVSSSPPGRLPPCAIEVDENGHALDGYNVDLVVDGRQVDEDAREDEDVAEWA